jgi:glycosyltransferase involved in cell wall biosynthesis
MPEMPRVALVIDALASFTGAERVLATVLELYPDAPIFTLAYDPSALEGRPISARRIHTSWIQRLPWGASLYRNYLPLLPMAVESFDLRGYEIVLSFSYAVAHGVVCRPDQLHVSYTFAPLRYAWQSAHEYFRGGLVGAASGLIMHYLRLWDFSAAARVDHFAAISRWTAQCVQRAYRRPAEVIYPPVETGRFHPAKQRGEYYVAFSRLVRHKRLELVVQAFSRLGLPLVIIGAGPERRRLGAMAGQNTKFVGWQTDEAAAEILGKAKALVHAAQEDFGLVMAEAQAAGCPVIGYAGGAAREIMVNGETGLLFHEQTADSIAETVRSFAKHSSDFRPEKIVQNARRFGKQRFREEFVRMVQRSSLERSDRVTEPMEDIRLGGT